MTERQRRIAHLHPGWAIVVACALVLPGCGGANPSADALAPSGPVEPGAITTSSPGPSSPVASSPAPSLAARAPLEVVADPVRVRLPRLDIDAALQPLKLGAGQELLPPDYGRAGWYRNGPEPGEAGRAVIAGHVDSKTGPDVFAALGRARAGDRIVIELENGDEVRFRVRDIGVFLRSKFPTDRVYGGSQNASELRLITCTGEYDRNRGGYQSNVVVFADLVS